MQNRNRFSTNHSERSFWILRNNPSLPDFSYAKPNHIIAV
ncbi:MAG: hypothetical protein JW828_12830 [Sedimentisphaerales bacterium]|nr:hypothetical protein [Sedimentisphaerales bacterium]